MPDIVPIRTVLERNAADSPDRTAVTFEDESPWTFADALSNGYGAAEVLQRHGTRQGDCVGFLLPNGSAILRAWWGAECLGAVAVPANPIWKGEFLRQALLRASVKFLVVDPKLRAVAEASLDEADGIRIIDASGLTAARGDEAPSLDRPIELWDLHHVQFTSGTTGVSKAAAGSHLQFQLTGNWYTSAIEARPEDIFLCDLPLFHLGCLAIAGAAIAEGAGLAVRRAPSLTSYWRVAHETNATFVLLLSTMPNFLMQQPPGPYDRDHRVRVTHLCPLPADVPGFQNRFAIAEIVTAYGSSECSTPLTQVPGRPLVDGSCGRQRDPYILRIVDENDNEVPVGTSGELVIRSDVPWSLSTEYLGNAEASVRLWRNGWLHTGDRMRLDSGGNFFFVDRMTDSIRRRGENISSVEVESLVQGYPGVLDVACVAVPDDDGVEDEVKVWLLIAEDQTIDFMKLVQYLVETMPYYMVPRYYEAVAEFPKTPSNRVMKSQLRARPNGSSWDIQADGRMKITRRGLQPLSPSMDDALTDAAR
jgi:crotonobetaine/carnitine-CoA ligase